MIESFNKFVKAMIDNREYSPGIKIKIEDVEFNSERYPLITYKISILSDGKVPYEIFVISQNIKFEIEELRKYMPFDKEPDIDVEVIENPSSNSKYFNLTKEFKDRVFKKISEISSIDLDEMETIEGKFLPRLELKDDEYGMTNLIFYFRAKNLDDQQKLESQDMIDEYIKFTDIYKILGEAYNFAGLKWPKNFYFEESGIYQDLEDYLEIRIKII